MSKTHRHQNTRFDDDRSHGRGGKHKQHSNNRKNHGMPILNSPEEDEYEDDWEVVDSSLLNKVGGRYYGHA